MLGWCSWPGCSATIPTPATEDPDDVRADATRSLLRDRLVHVEAFRGCPSSKHRRLDKNVLKHRILPSKRLCPRLPNSLARQKRRSLLFAFALAFRPLLCPPAPALLPNYAPRPRIVAVPAKHKAISTTTTSIKHQVLSVNVGPGFSLAQCLLLRTLPSTLAQKPCKQTSSHLIARLATHFFLCPYPCAETHDSRCCHPVYSQRLSPNRQQARWQQTQRLFSPHAIIKPRSRDNHP